MNKHLPGLSRLAAAGLLMGALAAALPAWAADPISVKLTGADHASYLYYPKEDAKLELLAQNTTDSPQTLAGSVEFVALTPDGEKPFEVLSVTPIVETTLQARQAVKLPIEANFGSPGRYEIRWQGKKAESASGLELDCIFPPRVGQSPHWVSMVPAPAKKISGYLADYVVRTSVNQFVVEVDFPAAVKGREHDGAVLKDIAAAKAQAFICINLREGVRANQAASLQALIANVLSQVDPGVVRGVVLIPPSGNAAELMGMYRPCYLATYEAVKKKDKDIAMLGAGSAQATTALLLTPDDKGTELRAYVDAMASSGSPADVAMAREAIGPEGMVAVLPVSEAHMPSAVLLSEGVNLVPVMDNDRGVLEHLFGGTALFERLHPGYQPYVGVFQGDGYSVAAIAGPGAGTPEDTNWENLPQPRGATMEVADENHEMRLVDEAGRAVKAHVGDVWKIPLDSHVRYLIQGGTAEDQAALLRAADSTNLPFVDVGVLDVIPTPGAKRYGDLRVKIRNARPFEVSGTLKVSTPAGETLVSRTFVPISTGKWIEALLPLDKPLATDEIIIEATGKYGTQKQRLKVPAVK